MKVFNYFVLSLLSFVASLVLYVAPVSASTMQDYASYLDRMATVKHWTKQQNDEFAQQSWRYWMSVKEQVNATPSQFSSLINKYHQLQQQHQIPHKIDVNRFKSSIEQFERFDQRNSPIKEATLFIGSSSIVYWKTALSFPQIPVINRGFGGASIAEIEHFYPQVVKAHNPKNIVLYSDIDIENNVEPKVAVANHKRLIKRIEQDFPKANILILAMKPTLVDFILGKDIRNNKKIANELLEQFSNERKTRHFIDITQVMYKANQQLNEQLFLDDGMHLNDLGYQYWQPLMVKALGELTD